MSESKLPQNTNTENKEKNQPEKKIIPIVESRDGATNSVVNNESKEDAKMVSLYAAQKKIHPRMISGIFNRWRWIFVFLTQLVFYGLPWLEWGARQAVLFDLDNRRFYIFNLVLYPQDFIYLTALLIISALSLFLFTTVAGRLWCGFACPQTVYTEIFYWIEHKIEGDRQARIRLDAAPMNLNKFIKRFSKHAIWIILALWTGYTFVGYFVPIRELHTALMESRLGPGEIFWILFYSFATYGNAGFMREQICKFLCPYARFQSAMFDKDTLIVTYDKARGEPRGSRSRKVTVADLPAMNLGACVDCDLCVQVCPTGIDIRNGLQYECIGCGACADACDSIMDKMNYPRGLVRFSTQQAVNEKWDKQTIIKRIFRPRVLIYSAILWILIISTLYSLLNRVPLKVDVVRDRATLSRIVEGGKLENIYRLQIMNATEKSQNYKITASGLKDIQTIFENENAANQVEPAEARWVTIRLQIPYNAISSGSHPIFFEITDENQSAQIIEKSVFLVPN